MDFENIYRVESFLVNNIEEKYANELLDSGWKLLNVTQYKDDYSSYSKYVLGADKETFQKNNFEKIKHREDKLERETYGF